jgi:hypothetical protein
MANNKEGHPGKVNSQFPSPGMDQNPRPEMAGQTSPNDLARQREIFIELMSALPKAREKTEHTLFGERSPEDLARKREIFVELMTGLPGAYAKLKASQSRRSHNHRAPRPDDTARPERTPYEQATAEFRSFIQQEQVSRGEEIPPQAIIQERLNTLGTTAVSGPERARVWDRIASAWDALTHDSYPIASIWERRAGYRLDRLYNSTHNPTIELAHSETLIIGALAEAAGSPLERGIAVIEIPQHLRNYETWSASQEYQERVTNPDAARRK